MSDELVNSGRVTIVKGDPVTDFWLDGTVNRYPDYSFKAKVYDVGGIFGIGEGRISKLSVMQRDRVVMHYDRDWDQVPASRRDRKVLREILAGFPERGRELERDGGLHLDPPQTSRPRFCLFRNGRPTGRRGQRRADDHER
jgi:hypothetical protein